MNTEKLVEKWGEFKREEHYFQNGNMPFVSEQARLNVLFDPEDINEVISVFRDQLDSSILPELRVFYQEHNGCRLFFGSFCIFGLQRYHDDIFEPYDIVRENLNNYAKMTRGARKKSKMVLFATLGGDYVFGYDKTELSKIYCVKAGSAQVIKEYENFDDFWNYYFDKLLDEYDEECRKIHPNKEDVGIPSLEHLTYRML